MKGGKKGRQWWWWQQQKQHCLNILSFNTEYLLGNESDSSVFSFTHFLLEQFIMNLFQRYVHFLNTNNVMTENTPLACSYPFNLNPLMKIQMLAPANSGNKSR